MKRIFITEFVLKARVASALVLCLIIPAIVLAQATEPAPPGLYTPDGGWGKQGGDATQNQDGQQQQQQGQENPWGDFNPSPPTVPQNPGPQIDPTTKEPTWTGVDSNTVYPDGSKFVVHYYRDEYGRLNREMATIDKNGKTQRKSECKLPSGKVQNTTKPLSGPQSNLDINIQGPSVQDFMSKPQQNAPAGPAGGRAAPPSGPFFGGRGK